MKQYPIASVRLDALHVDPQNPQTHSDAEIQRLTASISELGFLQPIAVDAHTLVILAGHGRAEAARLAGYLEVPCVLVDDYDATKRRLALIATNGEYGSFDDGGLTELLHQLDAEHVDLDLTGLKPHDLDRLLKDVQEKAAAGSDTCPTCGQKRTP